ncbi:MAG: sulfatase-like hydrolase/transferase [Gemmatimonadota bacterium]|nr:sulfatase-like hydrolase/transferase [Gemmatimonadota bacterium]
MRGPGSGLRPNILLIVMDAARADRLSCYGYQRPTTPNIDRLAAEGLRFTWAVSPSSWTLPSHASLFTGFLPCEHGTHTQHAWLVERFPTLAELLKAQGYRTAGFSNNPQVDRAQNLTQGFDTFDAVWADTTVVTPGKPHSTEFTNRLVYRFLDHYKAGQKHRKQQATEPFFIFINYMDTHTPYAPPEPYRSKFLGSGREVSALADSANYNPRLVNQGKIKLTGTDYRSLSDLYDGSLNYLDSKIGELLDHLKNTGLYDSTLVIITSDHGELFGGHGYFTHGVLLYWKLLHVPLILHHPGLVPVPGVRDNPVALADIFHTLAHLFGAEGEATVTGAPVTNLLAPRPAKTGRPCYSELRTLRTDLGPLVRRNNTRSVLRPGDNRHFILTEDEFYECYDVKTDPEELHNLCPGIVKREEVVAALDSFEARLLPFKETLEDLRSSRRIRIDPQQEAAMRALGYVAGTRTDRDSETLSWHGREHFNTGVFHMGRRQYLPAKEEFNKTLVIDPDYRPAHLGLGQLLFRQRRYRDALQHFLKIGKRFPDDPEIKRLTTVLYAVNGKADQAERLFNHLAGLYPEAASRFFNQQANMFLRRKEQDTALILFDLLRRRFPQDPAYEQGYRKALRLKKNAAISGN